MCGERGTGDPSVSSAEPSDESSSRLDPTFARCAMSEPHDERRAGFKREAGLPLEDTEGEGA
jgi:hypothetical protein